ncbi:hypothetical protein AB1Y20_004942 [Prymnesium parvum]|uniref:Uncharacterized protein n=1 Tax=Prymnesium parvum TaxID=97485 RepID=A0AB34J2Q9_PRYPA
MDMGHSARPRRVKRTLAIATLLHPSFKSYDFIDGLSFIAQSDKAWALRELRTEWKFLWKDSCEEDAVNQIVEQPNQALEPAAAAAGPTTAAAAQVHVTPVMTPASYTKVRKVTLGSLLRNKCTTW